jgi:hypothetical protein
MLMSFTEPVTITIDAVPFVLPRVSVEGDRAEYRSSDGAILLSADHDYGKRTRRVLRLDVTKLSPDTFKPSENVKNSMSCYIVFDLPPAGFTNAVALAYWKGLASLSAASSDLMINKLLGGES